MTSETAGQHSSPSPTKREDFSQELTTLLESTKRTLRIYAGFLLLSLLALFCLAYFSIIPTEPVRNFDAAKEDLFFEKYNSVIAEFKEASTAQDILDPGMVATIRDHIHKLEMEWPKERIRREISSAGWSGGAATGPEIFRINLGLKNSWTLRRDFKYHNFIRFQLTGSVALPGVGPIAYIVGEDKGRNKGVGSLL